MSFPCASCNKVCETQHGLALHSRAKHHPYYHQYDKSFASHASLAQHRRDSPAHRY
jgi:hypothetical protein